MLLYKRVLISLSLFPTALLSAQTIGTFYSVQPDVQSQNLVLPATHTFQRLLKTGNVLASGESVGSSLDFTGYVPVNGSSSNGYLSINSETGFANVTVLSIAFSNATKLWTITDGHNVQFPQSQVGLMGPLCAGTVMPNGHVMVCEESMAGPDSNGDGYFDDGWISEIDPATHAVINQDGVDGVDKLWAMGRQQHEDVAMPSDMSVAYWSADNSDNGFVYKFIPTVPGNFSSGSLYVLKTTSALGTGTWEPVANASVSDCNNTVTLSNAAGAYNFVRIEGLEIGPDRKIYFTATTSGRVYRFRDLGTSVDQLEVFVESTDYDVDGAGPYTPVSWGSGADNLAFDGEGNLWVLQDGGNNYIWVVGANHTAANPNVRLFAIMPTGSEPTGITFSPDYKFLFMSVQHPNNSNTATQTDAAGNSVAFDESTAIVIARKENLGTNVILPVSLVSFQVRQIGNTAELEWKTAGMSDDEFTVERSVDGVHFNTIGAMNETASSFRFMDDKLPPSNIVYYRLKQKDKAGKITYSETKAVRLQTENLVRLFPSPVSDKVLLQFASLPAGQVVATVINAAGVTVKRQVRSGANNFAVDVKDLPAGMYYLVAETTEGKSTSAFIKQ